MKNELEEYVAEKLKEIDPKARRTKASGASTEIADILSEYFYVECKMRNTKNATIERKVWRDFIAKTANPNKIPFLALQNNQRERWIVMDAEHYFDMMKRVFNLGFMQRAFPDD